MESEEIGAAIRAFMAETCPVCDGEKDNRRDAFCIGCLSCLPPGLKDGVSEPGTFLDVYHQAVAHIKQNRPEPPPLKDGKSSGIAPERPRASCGPNSAPRADRT